LLWPPAETTGCSIVSSFSDLPFVKPCCFCLSLLGTLGEAMFVGRALRCSRRRRIWNWIKFQTSQNCKTPVATSVKSRTVGVLKFDIIIDSLSIVLFSFKFVRGDVVNVILLIEDVFNPNQKVNHAKTTDARRPITNIIFHVLNK